MRYINPFDLLEITPEKLSDANGTIINKAKRKLFAEIELSDSSTIVYEGIEISKGDCLRVIDELDNRDKKEFHFFIYQHKYLNHFLAKGKLNFFENYQAESIYKLPEFLDFISQFFAEQYDRLLFENYKRWNHESVAKILSVKPITNEAHYEKCYKSTYAYIKEIETEINEIINDIANNKSPFIDKKFSGLDKVIIDKVNVPLLNLLPSYFQNLRNQLAMSIRNLARDINNDPFNLHEPAFKIIEIAYSLSIDALTKQTITKGYYTIKKNYDDDLAKLQVKKQEEANYQIYTEWSSKADQVEAITKEIVEGESGFIKSGFLSLDLLICQIADPVKLNSLSDNFQRLKNKIATNIRALAKIINNKPYQNYKIAYDLITIAQSINSDGDDREKIQSTFNAIKNNFDKQIRQQQIAEKLKFDSDMANRNAKAANNKIRIEWEEKVKQIKNISKEIEEGISPFISSDFFSLDTLINQIADPPKLNSLSDNFQEIRNQVAGKVCLLAATINNEPHQKHKVAYEIISIANSINSDGIIAENISSAYETIKRNFDKQVRHQQTASNSSYNKNSHYKTTTKKQEPEIVKNSSWKYKIFMAVFCVLMIWALFNPIVQKVILSLSALFLGIKIYYKLEKPANLKKEKPIDLFFFFLSFAACVGGFFYLPLALLYISYNLIVWGHSLALDVFMNTQFRKEISFEYLLSAALITIMILAFQESQHQTMASSSPKENVPPLEVNKPISSPKENIQPPKVNEPTSSNYSSPSTVNSNTSKSLGNNYTYTPPPKPVYNFPYMGNGNIAGCNNIHSQYNKDLSNKLIISCGGNADIAVKLINYITDKSIRYVYIHKNTTYTIWNIPEGKYYLKIAYGSDWGVKAGESNCEGRFTSKAVFEKGEEILDYNLVNHADGTYEVPSFSLKLNVIYRTNDDSKTFNTNNISENDFYYE